MHHYIADKYTYGKGIIAHYTASLDAAMTLVPEGMVVAVVNSKPSAPDKVEGGSAFVGLPNEVKHAEVEAATPALALCTAALKARGL